tara:strand:- start:537 stop:1286 length:750 start_codon:yes stop_codon:yes gene_type:complete
MVNEIEKVNNMIIKYVKNRLFSNKKFVEYSVIYDQIKSLYFNQIMKAYNISAYDINNITKNILSKFLQWVEPQVQYCKDGTYLKTKKIINTKHRLDKTVEIIEEVDEEVTDTYEFWEVYTHPFSKFYNCGKDIEIDGIQYKTIEHYYQSQKVLNTELKQKIIDASTHEQAHLMGQCVDTVHNWFEINNEIYYKGQKAKFNQFPELKKKLMDTEDKKISCLDSDKYWGCIGKNTSGKLLEKIRDEFRTNS